ncbi:hypothetical protein BDQ12DRAFT_681310 [Crucibulum laeve]|uniref:CID domain-containing protein n=1 Tax=Crucibulum laeve TaxID=68775 RepID=A0A5C3M3Q2_9AGAR|nr:hypothetical protein BDQ12DRAFT_681310 [Crucibulum laeve]
MEPMKEFESVLKEVVNAKRLSASKMSKLTEIALKSMEHDTKLVATLYRTHRSLPTAAKVHSLYVFDALARAARHQANKHNLAADPSSQKGNCATFLLKLEGIVESLFQDMISSDGTEAKEKSKKVLDIWSKGNTFPTPVLSRLSKVLEGEGKVLEKSPQPISDPRTASLSNGSNPITPVSTVNTLSPTMDPQATLLALLAQAANSAVASTSTQTSTNTGGVDAAQLLLHQLAQTAAPVIPGVPPIPFPSAISSQAIPSTHGSNSAPTGAGMHVPLVHRDGTRTLLSKDPRHDRYRSPDNGKGFEHPPDNRTYSRGSFRGAYSSRGRGDRRRWDDRDQERDRYRDHERDRSPPLRGGRSRSRSPPSRYGARRAFSPPRRRASPTSSWQKSDDTESVLEPGKDEFGRDIRPQSPDDTPTSTTNDTHTPTPPKPSTPIDEPPLKSSASLASNHEKPMSPLVDANTSSSKPIASFVSSTPNPGMEEFNLATFNFTSPSSWEVLGKMWQVTYGYLPSTEELMQFVMSGGIVPPSNGFSTPAQAWVNSRGRGGPGGFRGGRGGFTHGKVRNNEDSWNSSAYTTDAVVLGGDDSDSSMNIVVPNGQQSGEQDSHNEGHGGRMQRVGEKWVFVRDSAVAGLS